MATLGNAVCGFGAMYVAAFDDTNVGDDPWARAAYSTSPPRELAELFAGPTGPLAFAGEHLGGEYAALMEGAIRSGRRAAAALLGSPSGDRA